MHVALCLLQLVPHADAKLACSAYFDQPVENGGVKFKRGAYHVVE